MTEISIKADETDLKKALNTKTRSLTDIIKSYQIITLILKKHAEYIPVDDNDENIGFLDKQEWLLDQQQKLLAKAVEIDINNIDDLTALMELWHIDEVESRFKDDLSASQILVNCAYDHLVQNKHLFQTSQ